MTSGPSRPNNARRAALSMFGVLIVLVTAIMVVLLTGGRAPLDVSVAPTRSASVSTPLPSTPASPPAASTDSPVESPSPRPSNRPSRSPRPSPTPSLPTDSSLDAALARCPTAAEVAFVDSRLDLTFLADPTAPELVCRAAEGSADLTRQQERVYQAVLTMRRLPFDKPLKWTNRPLLGWFTRAVGGIIMDGNAPVSYCCENDRIVLRGDMEMAHLASYGWDDPGGGGLVGLVALMIHEARHNEGYLHDCNATDPSGQWIDDQTLAQMGSWGVQYYFQRALAEDTSSAYMTPTNQPSDAYRLSALESMDSIRLYRICEPPPA